VYNGVKERIEFFNENGGFVFNAIHKLQVKAPTENMLAMLQAVKDNKKNKGLTQAERGASGDESFPLLQTYSRTS